MTDADGNSLDLEGKTISFSNGTDTLEFTLGGDGDNSVANLNELNAKLAENEGFAGLKASISGGKITFTNSSLTKEEVVNDATGETITSETGKEFTVNADAFGVSGTIGYKAAEATDDTEAVVTSLTGDVVTNYGKEFTSSDISSSTKLKDIGVAVGTTFSINGQDFVVDDTTTLSGLASGLSKMGITASFDGTQGRFYLNASATGADNDFNITSDNQDALELLGLGSTATKIDAKDAIIDYNGVEYRGTSNTFSLNGLTITAQAVTGEYNAETGEFKNDTPINIAVTSDTDSMYSTIKNFVNAYNTLIDEMNTLYNEEKTDYEPLTDDERSELSDTQIEKWEAKAKQGILRRDSTISSMLSRMRTILNSGVEVTNSDGTTTRYSLYSLGITTSSDYTENGKLHIMGDEDDADYADQENVLKKKLEENPEVFAKVFSGTSDNPGLGTQIYTYFTKSMKYQAGVSSSQTFYNNLTMDDDIDDWDDKIDDLNEKLEDLEDKYYDQFSAMETAMAKLQQQQSYLSSLMGTS
jgi:flagellar hook-associated protein 2